MKKNLHRAHRSAPLPQEECRRSGTDIIELQRMNRRLEILSETAEQLLASDSPQKIVDRLCKKVMAYLNYDTFFNFLVDEKRNCLRLNAYAGVGEEVAGEIEWLDYGAAVCGCVARDGHRIVCEHIPETPDPRTDLVRSLGIRAYACNPLVSKGRVIGTLSFGTRLRDSFTEDELLLMKTVADQIAIAIDRVMALDELEARVSSRTSELQEAVRELQLKNSELNLSRDALSRRSRMLESFFRNTITPLVFLDRDFNFIRVNEAYARSCQRDVLEFPGHNHFEFYPGEENEALFRSVVEKKRPYRAIAKPFLFPDHPEWGVTYWDWTLFPVLDDSGEVEFLVFSLNDVTEQKRAELKLRDQSVYTRNLLEASLDPLVTISADGKIMDVNKTTELVTGVSRQYLIGSDFSDYFTEPERAREGYEEVFSKGYVKDYPLAIRHRSGRVTHVLYNATLYRNEEGEVHGVFAAARDITARKEAENRDSFISRLLEEFAKKTSRRNYLSSVVRLIQERTGCRYVGVRVVNEDRYIPYDSYVGFSEDFMKIENMLSLDSDNCACIRVIAGRLEPQDAGAVTPNGSYILNNSARFAEQLRPEELARFRGNCIRSGFASIAIVPILYHNQPLGAIHVADERADMVPLDTIQFFESMAAPLMGEAIHRFKVEEQLLKSHTDLEERIRERTLELEHLTAELERSNADLRQFAYSVSHDLQEPLNGVGMFLKLFEKRYRSTLDEKADGLLDFMVDGMERMKMLIKDLLAYSQVDTKGGKFEFINFSVALEQAVFNLRAALEKSRSELTYDVLPSVVADSSQITRLFQNLIGNAIKYRGEERPIIHISSEKRGPEWVFSVRDNGIGIDPQYFQKIFDVFRRLHSQDEYEGTGIGLAICKKIVERHGGRIWVESEQEKGSTFYFTIPERQGALSQARSLAESSKGGAC